MNITFSKRHPLILSVILAIVTVTFATIAGIIISVLQLGSTQSLLVQTGAFAISALLGLILMKTSPYNLKEYGFCFSLAKSKKSVLWFLPLIAIEILPFFAGFSSSITPTQIPIIFIFAIIVGINEEVYFRGLILKLLSIKGTKYAIILSSVIFGVFHAFNALSGKSIIYIILQIAFAALFGYVCAEIVTITKSIWSVIIWHFSHDFIAMITSDILNSKVLIILAVQTVILLVFAVYLQKKHINDED